MKIEREDKVGFLIGSSLKRKREMEKKINSQGAVHRSSIEEDENNKVNEAPHRAKSERAGRRIF